MVDGRIGAASGSCTVIRIVTGTRSRTEAEEYRGVRRHVCRDHEIGGGSSGHDESSRTQAARWDGVSIGPTIMGAPQRGHVHGTVDEIVVSADVAGRP